MKLVSWNVNNRKTKVSAQCDYLAGLAPDLVALQEITPSIVEPLQRKLSAIGLHHSKHSLNKSHSSDLAKNRSLGVIVASRFPISEIDRAVTPWAEKSLSVEVQCTHQNIDLHSAYIPPGSSNGGVKIETTEAVVERVLRPSINNKILCGDFNCPQKELDDGTIITWGQTIRANGSRRIFKSWQSKPGSHWDDVERSLFTTLSNNNIKDAYRDLNGFEASGYSWVMTRKGKSLFRRYDHVFASTHLSSVLCAYLHAPGLAGLSDHSPMLAEFDIPIL